MDDREHENWQRLKAVFNEVIDLPDVERNAALARISAEQPTIIDELRSLLSIDTSVNSFLDEPVKTSDAPSMIGEAIGHYRITRELGRGGMGAVFEAEREDGDFDKRVAIKLTGHNIFSEELARRFRNEKQILAKLEHQNIVRLFDGGITANHIPYYVMEYVEGTPITLYCREKTLTTRERLQLFVQVLDAVSYAHRRLVVHRDLKPSNILVTDEGTVKLLDFGIAKALDIEGGTQTSAPLTPEYAAPEQIARTPVSTATDIYSLGILLFEMLTELPPAAVYRAKGLDVYRAVIETEPSAPSAAVTLAEREKNEEKQIDRGRLAGELRGDLDNIVLKCLGKEPESRYASADQLLADIEAFLAGRPVSVHPQSRSYRLKKFVGRNRLPVAAASMAVLLILAGLGMALYQWSVARQNQLIAEQRFQQVRKVANSLIFDYHDEISKLEGSTALRERLVTDAVAYLDAISQGEITDPELLKELGIAYRKIGDVLGAPYQANLGRIDEAVENYRKSIAILDDRLRSDGRSEDYFREMIESYRSLAIAENRLLGKRTAQATGKRTLEKLDHYFTNAETSLEMKLLRLRIMLAIGDTESWDIFAAREVYDEGLRIAEKYLADDPANDDIRFLAGKFNQRMSSSFRWAVDKDPAMPSAQQADAFAAALAHAERYAELFLSIKGLRPREVADACLNMSYNLISLKRYDEALSWVVRAEDQIKIVKERDPKNAEIRLDELGAYNSRRKILAAKGDLRGALALTDRALEAAIAYLGEDPNNIEAMSWVGHYAREGGKIAEMLGLSSATARYKNIFDSREAVFRELTGTDWSSAFGF